MIKQLSCAVRSIFWLPVFSALKQNPHPHTSSTQTFGQFHFDIKYPLETAILEINDAMNTH